MELYDDGVEKQKSKVPMIIGICIAILVIITIAVVAVIIYLNNSIITIKIDGQRNLTIEELFYKEATEEGIQLYMPIIRTAQYLKYEGFTGDYKDKSEDKTKCHVTSENETAMFSVDSDILIKIIQNSENEYIKLDKPVFEKDGELYTTIEGIQKAFNVLFTYDQDFKNVDIYTMDYLLQAHATNLKLENYSTQFADKKAIFEGMIIVEENRQYGVIDVTKKQYLLQAKYQEIKYLPTTTEFVVKSNGKYGIMTRDAATTIKTVYDEIKIIDNENGLYLVKQNNAYGILDFKGNIIIEPDYKQIGIDISRYSANGVENQYVLLDEIIPVKNTDNLWGLFNKKGEKVTDFKYIGIGCQSTPASNSYPALVIPSYKIIVVQNEKKYNLVTLEGEELIEGNIIDSVYFKTDVSSGQNKFYMTSGDNTKVVSIDEWLTSIGQ